MKKGNHIRKLNMSLVALLLLGMGYLGLLLFTGTASPFLLVRGQSMEPTLHAGDMLMQRSVSATDIKVGDIIAFSVPSDAQKRLKIPSNATHRVISIEGENGQLVFVTQGDNSDVDSFKVPANAVHGVVTKNLGPLGKPILFLTNRAILLFFGLPVLAFILIVVAILWTSPGEKREAAPAAASSRVARLPKDVAITLDRLTSAVSAYGVHLKSHTSVIKKMASSSDGLEEAVQQQNEILVELAAVVREMKHNQGPSGRGNGASSSTSGRKKSTNGKSKESESLKAPTSGNGHKGSGNGSAEAVSQPSKAKATGNGHKSSANGTAAVSQPSKAKATGNGHRESKNGSKKEVAIKAKASGNGRENLASGAADVDVKDKASSKARASGNGHGKSGNGIPPKASTQPLAKEEMIKDMVAEMEAKIKADIGWQS